jgi:serine/threonine-protein kinase
MSHDVETLLQEMEDCQLLSSSDLARVRSRWFHPDRKEAYDADKFGQWLVVNEFLTPFALSILREGQAGRLRLNQYRVQDQVTTPPQAGAYLATDPLQRTVLVDILARTTADKPAGLQHFQETAKKALTVSHPNVARSLDLGQAHGLHFLVREYFEGETLASVLQRRGRLAPTQAARLFALVLSGLQALHDKGVPAGALSAECLLLTPTGKGAKGATVKILETGFPRRFFDPAALGGEGTGQSLSEDPKLVPLQDDQAVAPGASHGPEEDFIKVGCTFFQCLTGKTPTPGQRVTPVAEVNPEIPDILAQIVDSMVDGQKMPRPKSAAALAKQLRVFLAAEEEVKEAKIEERLAAPTTAVAQDGTAQEETAKTPEGEGETGADNPLVRKLKEMWDEIKPTTREYLFLASGALGVVLAVLMLKLLTGIGFVNIICLLTGAAVTYFLDVFLRWRERKVAQ